MPTIRLQKSDLQYQEADIINFSEGLIGLANLRRMVLVKQPEIEPFLWLASLDDDQLAFLVIDPRLLVPDYTVEVPPAIRSQIGLAEDEEPMLLAISLIAPEWKDSTVNLLSPLVLAPRTMRGAQVVTDDNRYGVHFPLAKTNL